MEQQKKGPGRAAKPNTDLSARFAKFRETARLHLRRWAHILQVAAGETRLIGPASFLGVSAALGLALTLSTLYSTSYAVTLDGEAVQLTPREFEILRLLLQNPGKVSWIVMGAGAAVIAILTLLTVGIVRTVKKHRKKKK